MTRSLNFLVTVLVIWCWALRRSPRMRRWHLSILRWASHQPRDPFCRRASSRTCVLGPGHELCFKSPAEGRCLWVGPTSPDGCRYSG